MQVIAYLKKNVSKNVVGSKQYQGIVPFVKLSLCFLSSDAHVASVVLVCILTSISNVTSIQHQIQRP